MTNSKQDDFYLKKEANLFFNRWKKNKSYEFKNPNQLRQNKKEIYEILNKNINLNKISVLEIGCFTGDLLYKLKTDHKCNVFGVEPSSHAKNFCQKNFKINLENTTFINSKYITNTEKTFSLFDLIIIDDVLSWIDRSLILRTISSIDWLLKTNGFIFIRDFVPKKKFAFRNHHHPKKKIYNFKQKNGHREFFLMSGKYEIKYKKDFFSDSMQKIQTTDKQSILWGDTILEKIEGFSHPIKNLNEKI